MSMCRSKNPFFELQKFFETTFHSENTSHCKDSVMKKLICLSGLFFLKKFMMASVGGAERMGLFYGDFPSSVIPRIVLWSIDSISTPYPNSLTSQVFAISGSSKYFTGSEERGSVFLINLFIFQRAIEEQPTIPSLVTLGPSCSTISTNPWMTPSVSLVS